MRINTTSLCPTQTRTAQYSRGAMQLCTMHINGGVQLSELTLRTEHYENYSKAAQACSAHVVQQHTGNCCCSLRSAGLHANSHAALQNNCAPSKN
jgi:hypothetical protein